MAWLFNPKVPPPAYWSPGTRVSIEEFRAWVNENNMKTRRSKQKKVSSKLTPRQDYSIYQEGQLLVVIHDLPPSLNQWKTWHWSKVQREKKNWEELIIWLVKNARPQLFKNPLVKINFYFKDNRPRDPQDNYMSWKALMDGIKKAGIILDDCWQKVTVESPGVSVDRKNPRTEIIVREKKGT